MFIKVTGLNGETLFINPKRIMCIEPYSTRGYIDASIIVFDESNIIKASESPEKIKEYAKKYRAEHRDKIIACNKQRYEEHSVEVKERSKNYYHTKIKNNPEAMAKRREYCRKWRENRRANDGT